jgi:hemolysin III
MLLVEERTSIEEIANSLTHGCGLVLSLVGLAVLLVLAITRGNAWHIAGCGVYGSTLVILYLASTLYHSFRSRRARHLLRIIDQIAIYLFIAGTYTPFTLVNLRGSWGWALFGLVWALAIFGILFKLLFVNRFQAASIAIYLLMGWLAIIAVKPILALIPPGGLAWILAGGVAYTVGALFFVWERLPFNHTIWHLFVLVGSICHYFAVLFYVLPPQRVA